MVILIGGFLLFLILLSAILAGNRIDELKKVIDMQGTIIGNITRAVGARQQQLNGLQALMTDLISDDIDAANTRAALQQIVKRNEEYLLKVAQDRNDLAKCCDSLFELSALTFCCQARFGHEFECISVEMNEEEPVYVFECPICSLKYSVPDSQLTKKEEMLAKKYVDGTYMPTKKSIKKGK